MDGSVPSDPGGAGARQLQLQWDSAGAANGSDPDRPVHPEEPARLIAMASQIIHQHFPNFSSLLPPLNLSSLLPPLNGSLPDPVNGTAPRFELRIMEGSLPGPLALPGGPLIPSPMPPMPGLGMMLHQASHSCR
eukprot:768107-Hanusia_phi.AAC.2